MESNSQNHVALHNLVTVIVTRVDVKMISQVLLIILLVLDQESLQNRPFTDGNHRRCLIPLANFVDIPTVFRVLSFFYKSNKNLEGKFATKSESKVPKTCAIGV